MGYRTLEITIQYAEDLNKVNLISKMDVYVVVSISGGDELSNQKTKTTVNRDDDANPSWSFPMKLKVEAAALLQNRLILDFKIKCERALGDRLIGEVHVPVKDLLIDSQSKGRAAAAKSFISYQVKKPNGKPKGRLTFSYQFDEKSQKTTASAVTKPPPPLPLPSEHIKPFAPKAPGLYPLLAAPAAEAYTESLKLYPAVDASWPYRSVSPGGYPVITLEPTVVAPPPMKKVYGETMTACKVVEPTSPYAPVAPEVYPPIPPPLGYLQAGGLEPEWYPPPPPRPCSVYPPPVMQLAPDWWIVDWRYDTRCSGF